MGEYQTKQKFTTNKNVKLKIKNGIKGNEKERKR
jgi:hypothetical protein